MEPTELETRAATAWRRNVLIGLVVAIALAAIAVGLNGDTTKKTAVANRDESSESARLPYGDDELSTGETYDDSWMSATSTTAERTTTPKPSTTTPRFPDDGVEPDDPAGPTTTAKPDRLITTYALPRKGAAPSRIAAGFDQDLWFTQGGAGAGNNAIGRVTTDGHVTEFLLPDPDFAPLDITRGPDGAMWFTESYGRRIGRITKTGVISQFTLARFGLWAITTGPDGALWFTGAGDEGGSSLDGYVGRITTTGEASYFALGQCPRDIITAGTTSLLVLGCTSGLYEVTTAGVIDPVETPSNCVSSSCWYVGLDRDPTGTVWFSMNFGGRSPTIGRTDAHGTTLESLYPETNTGGVVSELTLGPDGNIWLAWLNLSEIQRMTPNGDRTSYKIDRPMDITTGPDGNIWFTSMGGFVGKLNPTMAASS